MKMKLSILLLLLVRSIDIDKLDDDEYWDNLDVEEDLYDMDFESEDEIEEAVGGIDDAPEKPNETMSGKVVNQWDQQVDVYFHVPGGPIKYFFTQDAGTEREINTFTGHTIFAAVHKTKKLIKSFFMSKKTHEYVVPANTNPDKLRLKNDLPLSGDPGATDDNPEVDENPQFPISFANNYAEAVDLYWKGNDDKGVYVTAIEGMSQVTVNTFDDHSFYVTKAGDKTRLETRRVTGPEMKEMVFGSPSTTVIDGASQDDDGDEDEEEHDLADEADLDEVAEEEAEGKPKPRRNLKSKKVKVEPLVSEWSTVIVNPLKKTTGFVAKFINLQNYEVSLQIGDDIVATIAAGDSFARYVAVDASVTFLHDGETVKESEISIDQIFYVLEGKNEKWNLMHKNDMKNAGRQYKKSRRFWYVANDKTRGKGFFWPASQVGQKNRLTNRKGFFTCEPDEADKAGCFAKGTTRLRLQTLSVKPRVIEVLEILGEQEAAY